MKETRQGKKVEKIIDRVLEPSASGRDLDRNKKNESPKTERIQFLRAVDSLARHLVNTSASDIQEKKVIDGSEWILQSGKLSGTFEVSVRKSRDTKQYSVTAEVRNGLRSKQPNFLELMVEVKCCDKAVRYYYTFDKSSHKQHGTLIIYSEQLCSEKALAEALASHKQFPGI